MTSESTIVGYWRELISQLSDEELIAYSKNGPIRRVLVEDILPHLASHPQDVIEIGALFAPLTLELPWQVSRALLLDPIYKVRKPQLNLDFSIELSASYLPVGLEQISNWLQRPSLVVLENVLNYVSRDTIQRLLEDSRITTIILGNNSQASFGDMHQERLRSPIDILDLLRSQRFINEGEMFQTETTLAGIFVRR
ncbi:hypothetical protein KC726_00935 [Candidatus Woesebacteria bacterium]|nr:hypothetical protein [Candidatus Woesebacteria bacterium]